MSLLLQGFPCSQEAKFLSPCARRPMHGCAHGSERSRAWSELSHIPMIGSWPRALECVSVVAMESSVGVVGDVWSPPKQGLEFVGHFPPRPPPWSRFHQGANSSTRLRWKYWKSDTGLAGAGASPIVATTCAHYERRYSISCGLNGPKCSRCAKALSPH